MNDAQVAQYWNISILTLVHTDADIEKIQLEIQAGPKAASKIIDVASSGSKEEEETSLYENIKAKLKKILGIENVFKVRDWALDGGIFSHERNQGFEVQRGKLAWENKDFCWEGWVLVCSGAASEVWGARKFYFLERVW